MQAVFLFFCDGHVEHVFLFSILSVGRPTSACSCWSLLVLQLLWWFKLIQDLLNSGSQLSLEGVARQSGSQMRSDKFQTQTFDEVEQSHFWYVFETHVHYVRVYCPDIQESVKNRLGPTPGSATRGEDGALHVEKIDSTLCAVIVRDYFRFPLYCIMLHCMMHT